MSSSTIYYLAYGSNLHPVRLRKRVPSAVAIDTVKVSGYRLRFNKLSHDRSAKCNVCYSGSSKEFFIGVVYQMQANHKRLLDYAEGLGNGYFECSLVVTSKTESLPVFFYVADPGHTAADVLPYTWYKELVLRGGEHHKLCDHYLDRIRRLQCVEDSNVCRNESMFRIVGSQ